MCVIMTRIKFRIRVLKNEIPALHTGVPGLFLLKFMRYLNQRIIRLIIRVFMKTLFHIKPAVTEKYNTTK
jgi:hypothetical protein